MSKVYLVLLPETLDEGLIEGIEKELAAKDVDAIFAQLDMPQSRVAEVLQFETKERG